MLSSRSSKSKLPSRPKQWLVAIAVGSMLLLLYILFVWTPFGRASDASINESDTKVDAFVFICMGKWTQTTILENAINSLRTNGRWNGPIYVLTDRSDGWPVLRDVYDTTVVEVPPADSKLAIHSYKCKMFDYLPTQVANVVYMDADIIISTSLVGFFKSLTRHLTRYPEDNMGLFRDSAGHFWGACTDCDYWHGGVMFATRGESEPCLNKWCDEIFSGKYTADQAALDYISENVDECSGMFPMDSKYLMFMKDYTSVMFHSAKTFSHVTAAGRLDEQSWFYLMVVRLKLGINMNANTVA